MMARSGRDDINQRISLVGDDEVRRQLEKIGSTGERALSGISRGTRSADVGLQTIGRSSGRVGGAVQQLSFQVNDLVTSFASGAPVMQVFAQQGGQIFQAFQQGGGLSAVLGGVTAKLKEFITPMRALAGVGAAAAAGVAVLGARAISTDNAVRQFKVTLDALRPSAFARGGDVLKGLGISPEDLEAAAKRLRSVGLSLAEGRAAILEAIQGGVDARLSEQVIRFGKDLDVALGEKGARSGEAFKKAIAGGKDELRKFGQSIGAINPNVTDLQDGLRDVNSLIRHIITNSPRIAGSATNVLDPLARQARDINVEFQNILDKMSLFFKEGFVNLVGTGQAAANVFTAFATAVKEQNFAGIGNGIATALIEGIKLVFPEQFRTMFFAVVEGMRQQFAAAWADTATLLQPAIDAFNQMIELAVGLGGALTNVWAGFTTAAQSAIATVRGWIQQLANAIRSMLSSLGSIGSEVVPGVVAPQFAAGGLVRGPGTGTSDSILARLSNNEFVVNARSTAAFRPLLEAINGLHRPLVPRSRGFAMGGLVAAGGGGGRSATINLALAGETFSVTAEDAVFDALVNKARRASLLSAGRKPGHTSRRRYGG